MADKYIYEVYKDGEYIGDYQMEELKKEFHMSGVNIRNAVAEGRTIRKKIQDHQSGHCPSEGQPIIY